MGNGILKKLPRDVTVYILLRIPTKSLMRFKCISKTWYRLMQSYRFINLHLNSNIVANEEFILFKRSLQEEAYQHKTIVSFLFGDDDNYVHPICPDLDLLYLTFTFNNNYDQLIGPCQGLIALINTIDTVLLNPGTRKYRYIPSCPFSCPTGYRRNIDGVGFGFDSVANDYKLVRISNIYNDLPYWVPFTKEQKVDLYEMSTDSWRELDQIDQELPRVYWDACSLLFYSGACQWLAIAPMDKMIILCFDMSAEIFHNISMPHSCNSYNGPRYGLVILYDSIAFIRYPDPNPEIDPAQDVMQIWIMKEYGVYESWIKTHTIRPLQIESPLTIWKDSLMLLENRDGYLIYHDLISDEVREFGLHGTPSSLRAVCYKECLIQIPSGRDQSTKVENF